MKSFVVLPFLLLSAWGFAQNSGSIHGLIMDEASYHEPLMYANVFIEGTALQSSTDENGLFHFEELAEGNYTLVLSFAGYETKRLTVKVAPSQPTNISAELVPRSLSLHGITSSIGAQEKD